MSLGEPMEKIEIAYRLRLTLRPTSRGKIIGEDPKILALLDTIDRIARSSCSVLVTGETGTGKELVVAALHDASPRRDAPLVTINCGAIPSELVESELFGHARGSFTGAHDKRRGYLSVAAGGTLFLDEIGEMPLAAQTKLLRVLQQREFTPIGETRPVRCDVRVVGATHRSLEADVAKGRFREDLYHRLDVVRLALPPLRERRRDARLLALHFFRQALAESGRSDLVGVSERTLDAIEAHAWPGNIRALENAMQRSVLLARGPIVEIADVFGRVQSSAPRSVPAPDVGARAAFGRSSTPPRSSSNPSFPRVLPDAGVNLASAVDEYQRHLIRQALVRTNGNKKRAADLLGVKRTTLVEMIRRRAL